MWLELMHTGGGVLALSWCPTGGAASAMPVASSSTPTLDRLGLLAAACADARVRIFAVPTQASLTAAESLRAFPAALAEADSGRFRLWLPPVLQLEPTVPVLTLALDWSASSPHLLLEITRAAARIIKDTHTPLGSSGTPSSERPSKRNRMS